MDLKKIKIKEFDYFNFFKIIICLINHLKCFKAFINNIRSVAAKNRDMVDQEQMEELKEAFTSHYSKAGEFTCLHFEEGCRE
jgi:hypothetical protein